MAIASSPSARSPDGDTLSISNLQLGRPDSSSFFAKYFNSSDFIDCVGHPAFDTGQLYASCAQQTFNDVQTGSVTASNNHSTDAFYDACGNLVGQSQDFNWEVTNNPGHLNSGGWIGGETQQIAYSEPLTCHGTWTMAYSFTQTFSDGDTLTVSDSTTFFVPSQVVSPAETQGGGNPAELPCQQCTADPVNTATGDYSESTADLAIGGRGPGLQMQRTYSSLAAVADLSSPVGAGWSFGYGMSLAFDPTSGDATVTNANASQTTFSAQAGGTYAAPARMLATLVANGDGTFAYRVRRRVIYTFTSQGKLSSIADLNGYKVTLAYNGSSQLSTATDQAGRTLTFAYDTAGLLASVTDSTGRTVVYGHDPAGNLTSVTDVRNGSSSYTYDGGHLLLTRTEARGHVVMTNTYDAAGRAQSQTDGLNHATGFTYSGNPSTATQVTDPNGNVTEYDYYNGLLTQMTRAFGTSAAATWKYVPDIAMTLGPMQVTDPHGNISRYAYDAQGNVTSATDPLGHHVDSSYDAFNDLTSRTDAKGVTTSFTYDATGNLLTRSTPLNGSTTQTYTYTYGDTTHPGDLTAIKDPLGHTTSLTYNAAGDIASKTDPAGDKTTYPSYNVLDEPLSVVTPRGNVTGATPSQFTTAYTYDAAGNRLTVTDPLGHKTTSTYDPDGNVATVTDPRTNLTTYTYDADNRQTKVARTNGTTLLSSYDGDGNLLSQTDGANQATSYTYDAFDHLVTVTDPLSRTTTYTYDPLGLLSNLTDPAGRTTTYSYSPTQELASIGYSDGTTPAVAFGYDANGRRTSMGDGSGSSSYGYDALGRLIQATDGHGDATSFGYDLANNQTSVTYPNTKTLARTFDTANRTATIADWLGNTTTYGYDVDSGQTSISFARTHNTDNYVYDNADQLKTITMLGGSKTLASLAYLRDPNNQVTSETPTGLPGTAQTYTYNQLNQLSQAATKTYAYDPADNPTTLASVSGLTYDPANELTQSPTATYAYSGLGERTQQTPTSGPATTYAYNQAGELRSAAGAATATYSYDGDGLRTSKTNAGSTSNYAWDESSSLPLLLSDGATSYIYGPDNTPLEQITSAGTVTYYHHDQLGSTRLLTSSSGSVVGSFSYDPYGKQNGSTGTTTTPLGYAGQYTDPETGLQYDRARYYDPQTGQFTSRDPLEEATREPYSYAGESPLNNTDPSGLCSWNPLTGSFWTDGNCLSHNAVPAAEAAATIGGCTLQPELCPAILLGAAGADVAKNDVNEALHPECARRDLAKDVIDAASTGAGLILWQTINVATKQLAQAAARGAAGTAAARDALHFLSGAANAAGVGQAAAGAESGMSCGC
jgi:RHS repeat-associated protein